MNLVEDQYVFANQTDTFEANLAEASEYCASLDSNSVSQETTITPLINALYVDVNEVNESNSEISLSVTSSDISNNCITYGNVVLLPTILNDDNQQNRKAEHNVNQSVLSSDSSFLNTFLQAPNIDGNASAVLCETPTQAFNERHKTHATDGISAELNQIDQQQQQQQMYHIVDSNHVNIEMSSGVEPEMLLRDEHGQLYRPVQNIFNVDGTTMCSNELLPIIATTIDIGSNPSYDGGDQVHLQAMQNTYQQNNNNEPTPYEIPVNFISTANPNERTSDTINSSTELQPVQFIFDSYGNSGSINDINQSNAVDSNQFQIAPNVQETNYQTQFEMQTNKEEQSLFESISLTLRKFFFASISLFFIFNFNNFSQWLQ